MASGWGLDRKAPNVAYLAVGLKQMQMQIVLPFVLCSVICYMPRLSSVYTDRTKLDSIQLILGLLWAIRIITRIL